MTSPDRWALVRQLLDAAVELPPEARAAHLASACAGDPELRAEVESLLRACEDAARDEAFLGQPAAEFAVPVFAQVEAREPSNPVVDLARLGEALAGRYTIERELGHGGMATVFLAHDLRHLRTVALKVMTPGLLAGSGAERFLREIRIVARLPHPHILPLHDSGAAGDLLYYVMPFVEGESLRTRLAGGGPLPIGDTVRILREVASALAYAHRQGIVHRDIKPENILLQDGHAMVADFGIARAIGRALSPEQAGEPGEAGALPTDITHTDAILGTPAYMAPEQSPGNPQGDPRADLYALGVVAYEMLAGAPPFVRHTPEDMLAAHRTKTAEPLAARRPEIPGALADLVQRLLAKRPEGRPEGADRVLAELEQIASGPGTGDSARKSKLRGAVVVSLSIVGVAGAAALLLRSRGAPTYTLGYTTQLTRDPDLEILPALSPDGAVVAYVAGPVNGLRLYTRPVAGGAPVDAAPGLPCNPLNPKWSPDGNRILFHCEGAVYVLSFPVGTPRAVVNKPGVIFTGAAWDPTGTRIVYAEDSKVLMVFDLASEEAQEIARGVDIHDPAWSHDGRWITAVSGNTGFSSGLYQGFGNLGPSMLVLVPAEGGDLAPITDSRFMHMSPLWAPEDRGLFLVSNEGGARDLWFLPLDGSRRPAGPARRLTTGLQAASIALSRDGRRMAYSSYALSTAIWTVAMSRTGPATLRQATQLTTAKENIFGIALSPDGAWLAFDSDRSGNADIWKMPVGGGEPTQISTDPEDDFQPDWSPDGRWIAYHSFRSRNRDLLMISPEGGRPREILATRIQEFSPRWSPDGSSLAFYFGFENQPSQLNVVRRLTDSTWGEPRIAADTAFGPNWSPDGRWLAYLAPQPKPSVRVVPADGGRPRVVLGVFEFEGRRVRPDPPAWSADGLELFMGGRDSTGWNGVFSVAVSGGAPRHRLRLDEAELRGFPIVVRANRLYVVLATHQSDLYMVDLKQNARE